MGGFWLLKPDLCPVFAGDCACSGIQAKQMEKDPFLPGNMLNVACRQPIYTKQTQCLNLTQQWPIMASIGKFKTQLLGSSILDPMLSQNK